MEIHDKRLLYQKVRTIMVLTGRHWVIPHYLFDCMGSLGYGVAIRAIYPQVGQFVLSRRKISDSKCHFGSRAWMRFIISSKEQPWPASSLNLRSNSSR